MDNIKSQMQYYARVDGATVLKTADVSLEDYKLAAGKGQTFKQHINNMCADADISYGCAFDQAVQAMGGGSKVHGGQRSMSPTISQFNTGMAAGPANMNAAGIIGAPDGQDKTPAGRIFYPEIVMDIMRESLAADNSDIERGFDSMIAVTENIGGGNYTQPLINVTANEDTRHQPIAQGTDPSTMISITTSQVSRAIPTRAIGLQITDQASNFATIDLVATAIAAQARGEKAAMVDYDLNAVVNGDKDAGITALVAQKLNAYDAGLSTSGTASHKAFLKMLHADYQTISIDSAVMDIDTYLAFEGRTGRPTVDKDRGTDERLNMKFKPMNWSLTDLNILIVDKDVIGANQALFLDTNYALRKVVDVTAQYDAVQQFVMRRISQMRFDYGQHVTRLYDQASKLITLNY